MSGNIYGRITTGLGYSKMLLVPVGLVVLATVVAGIVGATLLTVNTGVTVTFFLSILAVEVGFILIAFAYLYYTGLGLEYIDFQLPRKRTGAVGVGVGLLVFSLQTAIDGAARFVGIDMGVDNTAQLASSSPSVLVGAILINLLLVGFAEELFFRNILQKRLSNQFTPLFAIVFVSLLFAPLHLGNFSGDSTTAILVSLVAVFLASLIYGTAFEKFGRLEILAIAHGVNNSLVFLAVTVLF